MSKIVGKKFVFILTPVFFLLLILYMMVSAAYTPSADELYYPQGSLSDSIFVGQNNIYTKNPSLTQLHTCAQVPYHIDIPESRGATIGSGTVYQLGSTTFAYISEYPDYENIHDIICSQFPAALLVNYIPEETKIRMVCDKLGFINGFSAEYIVEYIQVADAKKQMAAVLMGYDLVIQEEGFESTRLFVGIGTTSYDNSSGDDCATLLDMIMETVRYDEKLAEKILKGRPRKKGVDDGFADGSVTNIPIVVRDAYDCMVLDVNWVYGNKEAILELFLPDGRTYCDPVEQTGLKARFVLDKTKAGTYNLRIQNYSACGDIQTTIGSHIRSSEDGLKYGD